MKYTLKATNIKPTEEIYKYLDKKIATLDKFIGKVNISSDVRTWVELELITRHHKSGNIYRAEVQIRLPKHSVRSEAVAKTINLAIDEVKDELQEELAKIKGKYKVRTKRVGAKLKRDFEKQVY